MKLFIVDVFKEQELEILEKRNELIWIAAKMGEKLRNTIDMKEVSQTDSSLGRVRVLNRLLDECPERKAAIPIQPLDW